MLAKNKLAKSLGVKTGMTIAEAKSLAPFIVFVEANHSRYEYYSKKVKSIYKEYTDKVESFGIDEAWLDVTETEKLFGGARALADKIRKRIETEIGLTVSIGISYNKIFAKFASDMADNNSIAEITKDNYKKVVWGLPVRDLLYVGRATAEKLNKLGIFTIGCLANYDVELLKQKFGKHGEKMWQYANGLDFSPVAGSADEDVKSIGNSTTFYRDLEDLEEIKTLFLILSESVSYRMKKQNVGRAQTVHITVVGSDLEHHTKQETLLNPVGSTDEILSSAIKLFEKNYYGVIPKIRGLGVSVSSFIKEEQLLLCDIQNGVDKCRNIDKAVEDLRRRFGKNSIHRCSLLSDKKFLSLDVKGSGITDGVPD